MPALLQYRDLPWPAKVYVAAAIAASLVLVAVGWAFHPIRVEHLPTLVYLAVGTQIAALLPIRWRNGVQWVGEPLLVATGLYSPGAGPGLVAWIATFDGRVPGRGTTWWGLLFNRAMLATSQVLPSMGASLISLGTPWSLPVQTAVYVLTSVALNYLMAALVLSMAGRTSFWTVLAENVAGLSTLTSTAILGFSGGILYALLYYVPYGIGYFMAPGLFGFLLAVRGNVADAQRQTELKDQTLELAAQALDARDRYTESHSIRVADLAGRLGEHLDLGNRECELLRTAGSLHDLGKIGVRDDILNKPGPLTDDEWEIMRRHPDIGADMIAQHSALAEVAPLVRHHHERWDGSGYPAGYKGDVIPFGARILSVADSFDTITGTRLYRRSLMTPVEGVEDISRRAGHWYDPNVVDALRALHGLEPIDFLERPEVPRRLTALRVLRANPGFARILVAIGISALGDPLTTVAALVAIFVGTNRNPLAIALAFIAQGLGPIVMSGAFGGLADRIPRRPLIVTLEFLRAALLFATPVLASESFWFIVPVLFVLGSVNSIVQPARQAAIAGLVPAGQLGKANAMVASTQTVCGTAGFGLAAVVLALVTQIGVSRPTDLLFVVDGVTFALAAALVFGVRGLGGGSAATRVTGSLRRAWASAVARPHLVVATVAAFLLSMSYPALFDLAYRLAPQQDVLGGETYSELALVGTFGIFVGTLVVGRVQSIGSMSTAGAGLLVTGIFSLAMALLSRSPYLVAAALFVASIGNPVYAIANQTALLESAEESNRASIMASRFTLVTVASIAGYAAGGLITHSSFGPTGAYGALAVGLIVLGLFAAAVGRVASSSLLGREYEEATHEDPSTNGSPDGLENGEAGLNHHQTTVVTRGEQEKEGAIPAPR
jgi:putative nucleotidyltransferase with HDIG domain